MYDRKRQNVERIATTQTAALMWEQSFETSVTDWYRSFHCQLQYNPSGGSDSDAGKKRSLRAVGRGRPPARRAAKRNQSDSEEESPPTSEEDSDVRGRQSLSFVKEIHSLNFRFQYSGTTEKEESSTSISWSTARTPSNWSRTEERVRNWRRRRIRFGERRQWCNSWISDSLNVFLNRWHFCVDCWTG